MRSIALDLGRKISFCEVRDGDVIARKTVRRLQELGRELGWDVSRLRAIFGDAPSLSLDAPQPGVDDVLTALDLLEDATTPDPFATLAKRQRHVTLSRLIAGLPEREQQVLALYYVEEMTMLETGRALGIGESRVSQLHTRAVGRLRKALRGQGDLP